MTGTKHAKSQREGVCLGSGDLQWLHVAKFQVEMHRNPSVTLTFSSSTNLVFLTCIFPLQGPETHPGHSAVLKEGSKVTTLGTRHSDKASTGPGVGGGSNTKAQ